MAAVALICMSMTNVVFTSCSEEKTEYKTQVYYKLTDDITYITSIRNTVVDQDDLINRIQAIVDTYNNQYLQGNLYLQSSSDGTNFTTIKTFTMRYGE